MIVSRTTQRIALILSAAMCLTGGLTPSWALALGIALALTVGSPWPERTHNFTQWLLQASVVGLGFGMNLSEVWLAGRLGFGFATATIFGTLLLGLAVGRALRVEAQTSTLIASGTAICGGSAIAAVGAVLNADRRAMSVALGTIFILNAIALFIFPPLGHFFHLTQQQFGVWAAIAIHDTSSVVGAAALYGQEALDLATATKLFRALWIAPLALGLVITTHRRGAKVEWPWFILGFLLAAAARSLVPQGAPIFDGLRHVAQLGLTLTLFLIGTGLSMEAIRTVGWRALLQGIILWIAISIVTLYAVRLWPM